LAGINIFYIFDVQTLKQYEMRILIFIICLYFGFQLMVKSNGHFYEFIGVLVIGLGYLVFTKKTKL